MAGERSAASAAMGPGDGTDVDGVAMGRLFSWLNDGFMGIGIVIVIVIVYGNCYSLLHFLLVIGMV